jgi:diadenosine tetraphosphatase ApaH/serine/threonine PP2A family protein phosphatase
LPRIIIYGDIHGCLDEWRELRRIIGVKESDAEIAVGDLFSKGPKPAETIRFAREHGVITVLGNHEERYLLIGKGTKKAEVSPYEANCAIGSREERSLVNLRGENSDNTPRYFTDMNENDLAYMLAMPRFLRLTNVVVVHAGLTNEIDLNSIAEDQKSILTHIRSINFGGGERFWAEVYNGNQGFAIYGHTPHGIRRYKYALGIDAGCVYGGALAAAILTRRGNEFDTDAIETVLVEARERYA